MKVTLLVFLLVATIGVHAQTDFTGTWKLNVDKSQFNNTPGTPAASKLVVEQKPGIITYQRNDRLKETLKMDSTAEIEITEGEVKTKVSMKMTANKSAIIETRTYSYQHNHEHEVAAKKTRTWSLSDDKKNLTILDHIESTTGKTYDMTLIYDRQ